MDAVLTQTPAETILAQSLSQETIFALPVAGKDVTITFEGGQLSSDGGALILREVERELGLAAAIAAEMEDTRDPDKITHTLEDMVRLRILLIACGYEDANDSDALRNDPVIKMLLDRLPGSGTPLASQPTLSRFENSVDKTVNDRLEKLLVDRFIASYPEPPAVIVVDADQTAYIAYGEQEQILFNGYVDDYCFMPLHIYEGLSGRLITTLLMPGKRPTGAEMAAIIQPLLLKLRAAWPNTLIVFRGDSHFAYPAVHSWIDEQPLMEFVTGLGENGRLRGLAKSVILEAEKQFDETKKDIRRFHSVYYQADSWPAPRRVVIKVEVTIMGTNVRYVVTSLENMGAQYVYDQIYCDRGRAELYIKDHKTYLKSDRTSCHSYEANRFRLLLHSAAYVVMHTFRSQLLGATQWAKATMETIRRTFLKVAARVRELKTRLKIEFPTACPQQQTMRRCFQIMQALRLTC